MMWSEVGPPSLLTTATATSGTAGLDVSRRRPGFFFPSRIALLVSVLLVVCGAASVVAGILAVVFSAAGAHWAGGVAAGVAAGIAGALGMAAGRRRGAGGVAGFLTAVVAAGGAAAVLVWLSVSGWREDRDSPPNHYFDENGQKVAFLGTTNFRQIAMVVNLTLVGLGATIGLLSLIGIIICIREICNCCRPSRKHHLHHAEVKVVPGPFPSFGPPSVIPTWFEPTDRLNRWLHHQYVPQWVRPKQWNQPFSPLFHTMASNSYSSGSYSSDASRNNYAIPGSVPRSKDPKRLQKEEQRRRRAKQKKKELRQLKKKRRQEEKSRGVTEEEVNSTYTGLDREMAEEFISVSMEPGRTINRVMNHSDDNVSINHNVSSSSLVHVHHH